MSNSEAEIPSKSINSRKNWYQFTDPMDWRFGELQASLLKLYQTCVCDSEPSCHSHRSLLLTEQTVSDSGHQTFNNQACRR